MRTKRIETLITSDGYQIDRFKQNRRVDRIIRRARIYAILSAKERGRMAQAESRELAKLHGIPEYSIFYMESVN